MVLSGSCCGLRTSLRNTSVLASAQPHAQTLAQSQSIATVVEDLPAINFAQSAANFYKTQSLVCNVWRG